MFDRFVGDREFAKIVSGHLRLDLNGVENLSSESGQGHGQRPSYTKISNWGQTYLPVVYPNYRPNHLWDDNHVTKVGLHNGRLLIWRSLLLGFPKFFNETHWFALQTALEPSPSASMDKLDKLECMN